MTYNRLIDINDNDIMQIESIHSLPEVSKFVDLDTPNFWNYVTNTENVYYYKVFKDKDLVGTVQLELCDKTLYMALVVFPKFQKQGIGKTILNDVQNYNIISGFDMIEVSIDENNTASIALFEKMNFKLVSKEDELLNYIYTCNSK